MEITVKSRGFKPGKEEWARSSPGNQSVDYSGLNGREGIMQF